MSKIEETEEEKEEKEDIECEVMGDSSLPEPKFLVIDTTEEELEELARIDAELEETNNVDSWTSDEESTLVSLWNNSSRFMKISTFLLLKRDMNIL